MKVKKILNEIKKDGWFFVRQKGSHHQYKHDTKKGTVTIAYARLSDELPPKTVKSIKKQAGI